jgi:hypothetical protein
MTTFSIYLTKEVHASYEITIDTDDAEVAQQLEEEKLRSYEYERSLKLEWDLESGPAEILNFDLTPSDEAS